MDRNKELSDRYGIDPERLDQMLRELSIIKMDYNGELTRNQITKKNAEALDRIAQAEPIQIPPQNPYSIDQITGARRIEPYRRHPIIEKISFKLSDGTTVSLTDPQAIESIRWHVQLLSDNKPLANPANRPPKPGREPLRSILRDFIAFRNKPNQNQQYLDAGQFLADIGFLMTDEQWEKNTDVYDSYIEYLTTKVKNALFF
jgi:hypothetical protein